MKFYRALQLNPNDLKAEIRRASGKKERRFLQLAMLVRAILIVIFSIVMIAPIAPLFGPENNAVGVVLICIVLSIRFVDFGYCFKDSLINLGAVFFLLWAAPCFAAAVPPAAAALLHFAALFLMFLMTSEQPEMGNGGLYAFSYIFLCGNPVSGALFFSRGVLLFAGYLLCAGILFAKHRKKHSGVRFLSLIRNFQLSDRKCQWQLQFALGVSLLMALGSFFQLERMMWAGFACASLLGCYSSTTDVTAETKERFDQRIIGAVVGSILFAAVYEILPPSLHSLFGPVGGICLGFCTDYRYKTALNCFGALMLAAGLYGLHGSVLLRIANNLVGAAFGYGFFVLYQKIVERRFAGNS